MEAHTAPARLAACECLTPFGTTADTLAALLRGGSALRPAPVLGGEGREAREGGDLVPLALLPGRALDETAPPAWLENLRAFLAPVTGPQWGTARRPICVTSSNFGVGSLYAYRRAGAGEGSAFAPHGPVHHSVAKIRETCGWGGNIAIFSHACVSASAGLAYAARLLALKDRHGHGLVDDVLVVSYDFLSPFVAAGFHSLKILNAGFPAPYMDRAAGSIALGDGAAYAVLTRDRGPFEIAAQKLHNEMHHFTANQPDGAGFATVLEPIRRAAAGMRVWVKGHGTGTLEAGRLEATAIAAAFPGAPLVGWKGALGHTLGSCGLVELAIAAAAMRKTGARRTPGTIGTTAPAFTPEVATAPFDNSAFDGVVCANNAFGGAHAALLLRHA